MVRRGSFLRCKQRCKQMSAAVLAALITLMLSAAVAGAITLINCADTNPCQGTKGVEKIQDSAGDDVISGYGGNDEIRSDEGGTDTVYGGDGRDLIWAYNDGSVDGEEGNDEIHSGGNSTLLSGGTGNDYIDVAAVHHENAEQTVQGGPGNDTIYAADGYPDVINCGGGKIDFVEFDGGGVDTVTNCEKKRGL
jgi:Ca2+-binding RTX toxin-like protein